MIKATNDWKTLLRTIPWLDPVTDAELDTISGARTRTCKAGQVIFSPSPTSPSVFFCIEGLVRIYRMWPDGAEVTLGYVGPRQVFGELALFGNYPRESFAMAVTDCVICELPTEDFRGVLDEHLPVAVNIAGQISQRMKRIESRVANLVFRNVFARMCATLVELGEDFGVQSTDTLKIDVPLTQSEFATLVGTSRQTINAGLKQLEDAGIVTCRKQRFILHDVTRLIELGRETLD